MPGGKERRFSQPPSSKPNRHWNLIHEQHTRTDHRLSNALPNLKAIYFVFFAIVAYCVQKQQSNAPSTGPQSPFGNLL